MTRRGRVSARRWRAQPGATAVVCLCGLFAACGLSRPKEVRVHIEEPLPKTLADWHLFTKTSRGLEPNARVIPYDLNTPLFSDYASKYRYVWMPQGTAAKYREDGAFDFPVGTILAKSFGFPVDERPGEERLIETRLLVHTSSGWTPLPYVWNSAQTEAMLELAPDPVPVRWTDGAGRLHDFTYQIPNTNDATSATTITKRCCRSAQRRGI